MELREARINAGLTLTVLLCKLISEYLAYLIGLVPSRFYANLQDPGLLMTVVRELLALIVMASVAKTVLSLFTNHLECRLQRAYTQSMLWTLTVSPMASKPVDDVEQRVMDDAKRRAQVECQLLDKALLPFLILWYTAKCVVVIPYRLTVPLVYSFAAVSVVVVRWVVAGRVRVRLAEQDRQEGLCKAYLCSVIVDWESVRMAGWAAKALSSRHFDGYIKSLQALATSKTILDGTRTTISYGGALVNYLILAAYTSLGGGEKAVSAAQVSEHSFLCLTLLYYLDQVVEVVELAGRRRVYVERMRSVTVEWGGCDVVVGDMAVQSRPGIAFHEVSVAGLPWRLSFTTDSSRITWMVGPNGSGKTTIVRLISGLCKPDGGRVYTSGGVFIVPQGPLMAGALWRDYFTAFTVGTNGNSGTDGIEKCLHQVGLHNQPPRTPGEWQRFHLARLLLARPEVAVLDEPCSHIGDYTLLHHIIASLPSTVFVIFGPTCAPLTATDQVISMPVSAPAR